MGINDFIRSLSFDTDDEYDYNQGFDEEDEDEEEEEEVVEEPKRVAKPTPVEKSRPKTTASTRPASEMRRKETVAKPSKNVTPMRSASKRFQTPEGATVAVIRPVSLEDGKEITALLLDDVTVLLNLEGLDTFLAQRICDYASGTLEAIEGHLKKVSNAIFVLAPKSVTITGDFAENLASYDYTNY